MLFSRLFLVHEQMYEAEPAASYCLVSDMLVLLCFWCYSIEFFVNCSSNMWLQLWKELGI